MYTGYRGHATQDSGWHVAFPVYSPKSAQSSIHKQFGDVDQTAAYWQKAYRWPDAQMSVGLTCDLAYSPFPSCRDAHGST